MRGFTAELGAEKADVDFGIAFFADKDGRRAALKIFFEIFLDLNLRELFEIFVADTLEIHSDCRWFAVVKDFAAGEDSQLIKI